MATERESGFMYQVSMDKNPQRKLLKAVNKQKKVARHCDGMIAEKQAPAELFSSHVSEWCLANTQLNVEKKCVEWLRIIHQTCCTFQ